MEWPRRVARARSCGRRARLLLGTLVGLGLGWLLPGPVLLSAAAGRGPARADLHRQRPGPAGRDFVLVLLRVLEGLLPERSELQRSLDQGPAQVRVGVAV